MTPQDGVSIEEVKDVLVRSHKLLEVATTPGLEALRNERILLRQLFLR